MNTAETPTGVLLAFAMAGLLAVLNKMTTALEEGTAMDFAIRTVDGADTVWTIPMFDAISMEYNLTGCSACHYSCFGLGVI